MTIAAVVAVALLVVLIGFQVALAAGVPWGAAAWGGQHPGVLPGGFRVASGVAALVVYPLVGLVLLTAVGILDLAWFPSVPTWLVWTLVGFFALGTFANAVSRSKPERIWAPVSAALAVCCVVIALGM